MEKYFAKKILFAACALLILPLGLIAAKYSAATEYREAVFDAGPPIKATCKEKGYDCIISATVFISTKYTTQNHDASLQEATKKINTIVADLKKTGQKIGKKPCLYNSKYGLLLIWTETGSLNKKSANQIKDPDKVADLLGIKPPEALRIAADKEKKLDLVYIDKVGYFWQCTASGTGCIVAALASANKSPVHDDALINATNRINAILSDYASKNTQPNTKLCILKIPQGLILSWVSTDANLKTDKKYSITPTSRKYINLISQSLGITKPVLINQRINADCRAACNRSCGANASCLTECYANCRAQ